MPRKGRLRAQIDDCQFDAAPVTWSFDEIVAAASPLRRVRFQVDTLPLSIQHRSGHNDELGAAGEFGRES
jgi:hypothetical protein